MAPSRSKSCFRSSAARAKPREKGENGCQSLQRSAARRQRTARPRYEPIFQLMSFSRYVACFAGSLLLCLSGRTADSPAAALAGTNITFRNHVQPVLAKFGCSSGACHGAAAGQNGFKLSLRGYDDEGDYLALTRHALGRRIIPSDPGRSLLLLKPTAAIPHKGGKRFDVDSREYRVLAEWISSGAPGPKPEDARIERIEFLPEHVVL